MRTVTQPGCHAFSPDGKWPSQLTHVVKEPEGRLPQFCGDDFGQTCVRCEACLACPAVIADEDIGLVNIHSPSVVESAHHSAGGS